jgi:TPR repeat protein
MTALGAVPAGAPQRATQNIKITDRKPRNGCAPGGTGRFGKCRTGGRGHLARPERVAEWLEDVAETGDLMAAFNIGVRLAQGVGLDQDEQHAAQWR